MSHQKAEFIKIPTEKTGFQTMPVEPEKRLADSEIAIEPCDVTDVEKIVLEPRFLYFIDRPAD